MKIKIPKSPKDLRLKHLKALEFLNEFEKKEMLIADDIKFISLFSGETIESLSKVTVKNIRELKALIVKLYSKVDIHKELPLELTYNGVTYDLRTEAEKKPAGWVIDSSSINDESKASLLTAFCYIEKGKHYAHTDKRGNIINPLKDRVKVFEEHLPLEVFLTLQGFFLLRFKQYKASFTMIQQARESLNQKKLNRLSGRK